jgi:hypothetical protein
MTGDRLETVGIEPLLEDGEACLSGSMPTSSLARDALLETGKIR